MEGSATGRLLTWDPVGERARTRVSGLRFPNGVSLGPDDAFVLVNEMLGYRTVRHWITGPRAGRTEPFVENYPGLPDDIRFNGSRLFWVALGAQRMGWVDRLQPHPLLKTVLASWFGPFVPDTDTRWLGSGAFVIAIDLDGNVVHNLQDPGRRYVTSTGVLEYAGHLYVGSVVERAVARIPVPAPHRGVWTTPSSRHSGRSATPRWWSTVAAPSTTAAAAPYRAPRAAKSGGRDVR